MFGDMAWNPLAILIFMAYLWAQEEGRSSAPVRDKTPKAIERSYTFFIRDAQTQEGLGGAVVQQGERGVICDSLGVGTLSLPVTRDTLLTEVRYMGYASREIRITPLTPVHIEVLLDVEGLPQEEVILMALGDRRTEVALLSLLRRSSQIATGLSAQGISLVPDRTTAQVISRITGVTLYDGRFLIIRGMNERYNATLINHLPAPSTEPDSRSFDLEVLPAGLLDQILIYKSGAAYHPADYGGGITNLLLRQPSDSVVLEVHLRQSYLHGTTGERGYKSVEYLPDLWGAGARSRRLPTNFPENLNAISSTEAQAWTRQLPDHFVFHTLPALPPNLSLTINGGRSIGNRFWSTSAFNYTRSLQNLSIQRYRYEMRSPNPGENPALFSFQDEQTTQSIRLSIAQSFIFLINRRSRLDITGIFLKLADDETILRSGFSFYQRADVPFRNYSMQYLDRNIGFLQIGGEHDLNAKARLSWRLGGTLVRREEPDFRRVRTAKEPGDSLYRIILPPGPTTFEAARFYSALRQRSGVGHIQIDFLLRGWQLIAGLQGEYRSRDFAARWFSYTFPTSTSPTLIQTWTALPISEAFRGEWLDQLRLREGTNPIDRYAAQQLYLAPFVSAERAVRRWSLQVGLRYEYSYQALQSATSAGPIRIRVPFPLLLPTLNVKYSLSEQDYIRLGYARSLNRPELREIAPFTYYNFALSIDQAGNSDLRPSAIHNLDLRYEISPSLDQLMSVGLFYKDISRPIENFILRGADNPIVRFGNAERAWIVGLESEARLKLTRTLYAIANLTIMRSQVDMGDQVSGLQGESQARYRPLQGQAPYLGNLILVYRSLNNAWQVTTAGQIFGPRIFWVGDNLSPTLFEMPRPVWDWSMRREFRVWYLLLQVRDLLNFPFVYRQDTNLDNRPQRQEDIVFRYVRGSEWSLQIGLKL